MSRASDGIYTAPVNSFNPAVATTVIDPDAWNAFLADVSAALNAGSQAEAEAGTNNTKLMTPLRTKQAMTVYAQPLDAELTVWATKSAPSGTVVGTDSKLSAFSSTTSSELRGVISDETGTGALVFGTSPTIDAPSITGNTGFGGAASYRIHSHGEIRIEATSFPKLSWNSSSNGTDLKKYQCYANPFGGWQIDQLNDAENSASPRLWIDSAGTIYGAGSGTFTTTTGAVVATTTAKFYLNFNGTGTPAVNGTAYNISSITDNGVGDYTLNFTTALPSANYALVGSTSDTANGSTGISIHSATTGGAATLKTTSAVRIYCSNPVGNFDCQQISVIGFGV
jgi:hypothetical protein